MSNVVAFSGFQFFLNYLPQATFLGKKMHVAPVVYRYKFCFCTFFYSILLFNSIKSNTFYCKLPLFGGKKGHYILPYIKCIQAYIL